MALTQTQVSQLYVAIFGRSSEGEGNTYWQTAVEGISATATAMLETPAAKEYFGDNLDTNAKFISAIYLNTLGKTATEDPDGIAYWVGLLNDGMSKGEVVAALIEAAQDPKNAGPAQDMFNNKVTVSNYTADNIAKADVKDLSKFSDLNNSVTSDPKTVKTAEKAVDNMAKTEVTGETQYLEVTQDILTGTAGNDLFESYVAQNQNGQQVNTLGSGDVIKGGAGYDTLDAQVTTGAYVNGTVSSNMAIAPRTESVENVVLHAEIADIDLKTPANNNDLVIVNAKNMNGVEKIASNYSDASLLIQNMTTKGVSGGTAAQTVAMEYTGNKDSNWDESDMTVYYDQDYLSRSSAKSGSELEIRLANLYENAKLDTPIVSFDSITIELEGKGKIVVDIKSAQALKGEAAYNQIVKLINEEVKAAGWETVSASTLPARQLIFSDDVNNGEYTQGSSAGTYLPILLTNTGKEEFKLAKFASNNDSLHGNRLETSIVDPVQEADTPVKINVDLEKVGLAADGGALVIGSMNKDTAHDNQYGLDKDGKSLGWGQGRTTTETVAGFDEFNVTVYGDKTKNSSLSALHSTNNSLRKVTIDSNIGSVADLTIGNSNTGVDFDESANNAKAFKDVQIMDASAFKGDLVLNAGFTEEIVAKYLINVEGTTVYGLDNPATELASFDYKGGSGNDTLNLAFDLDKIVTENFAAADTVGDNVFKMNVNGGAGNDTIIIDADGTSTASTATNITINGGAGNDIIDISKNDLEWTYNVAFNGTFGHDVIKGFNEGIVELTDEEQTLTVLPNFVAHVGEVIKVTVGNVSYNYTVTLADVGGVATNSYDADDIAGKVAALLSNAVAPATPTPISEFFTTAAVNGGVSNQVDLSATGKNVNSVTVEIISQVEAGGTYDKDTTPIHSATSTTQQQGGLVQSTTPAEGADTLDFSAYNVKGVVVDRATDLFGTDAGTLTDQAAAKAALFGTGLNVTTANKFIWLEASAHDSSVYNVYEATTKVGGTVGTGNIIFKDDVTPTNVNATKGNVIGSIDLGTDTIWTTDLDASQLLF